MKHSSSPSLPIRKDKSAFERLSSEQLTDSQSLDLIDELFQFDENELDSKEFQTKLSALLQSPIPWRTKVYVISAISDFDVPTLCPELVTVLTDVMADDSGLVFLAAARLLIKQNCLGAGISLSEDRMTVIARLKTEIG